MAKKMLSWVKGLRDTKKPNDMKRTPEKLAKVLIDLVKLEQGDTVLDGFAGDMVWYDNYPEKVVKDWCEIQKGRDFFTYTTPFDWVIGNPPYSIINKILDKCFEAKKGFALLLNLMNLTPQRIVKIQEAGFNITHLRVCNVKGWFGKQMFIICDKTLPSVLSCDTTYYNMPPKERKEFEEKMKTYQAKYYKVKKIKKNIAN
jgi:hypothetical protein